MWHLLCNMTAALLLEDFLSGALHDLVQQAASQQVGSCICRTRHWHPLNVCPRPSAHDHRR